MSSLDEITSLIEQRIGRRNQLVEDLASTRQEAARLERAAEYLTKALEIIQVVAKTTQSELEIHISEMVTLALEAVFPDPYKMVLSFELRRNRSEADLLLEDPEGNKVNPMDSVGGGVVDVAAFALRVAVWSLKRPRTRSVIILDEPMRFLSADLQCRASALLQEISKKLGIQFIIISHEENLFEAADKVFTLVKKNGVSQIKESL